MFNLITDAANPNRKRMKSSKHEDETKAVSDVNTIRPCLPDLVIHRILTLLPTKAAVRMSFLSKQWEGVWSLSPILDFDESGKIDDDDFDFDKLVQHTNFISILQRYLEFRERDKQTQILDRFRLCMTSYLYGDSSIVDKWLSFACEKSVKDVDLSLRITKLHTRLEFYYCLSRMSLFNAKSITTLKLEYVRIKVDLDSSAEPLLPCLKNMSLKSVHFDPEALFCLIWECPSIEYLSLTTCSFEDSTFRVASSNLKSLEITLCDDAHFITVYEAVNLEYFIFSSELWVEHITLYKSFNLKYISIHAQDLRNLSLQGCHHSAKAKIHTPGLIRFDFNGFLIAELSLEAPHLETAIIKLWDLYDGESRFSALRDFLKAFDGPDDITLYICDFKVFIFSETFREMFSSPMPRVKQLVMFLMSNPPTKAKDSSDLNDSLTWMAPYASRLWLSGAIATV
ncbi:hypothetical protein M0R45_013995 [Rubus argutus]|uniref:Uncharacterized protein n=1 Tax=Rubus argutus TaxID=59490 RepID=A0AAW1XK38_RUBAR